MSCVMEITKMLTDRQLADMRDDADMMLRSGNPNERLLARHVDYLLDEVERLTTPTVKVYLEDEHMAYLASWRAMSKDTQNKKLGLDDENG